MGFLPKIDVPVELESEALTSSGGGQWSLCVVVSAIFLIVFLGIFIIRKILLSCRKTIKDKDNDSNSIQLFN